MCHRDHRLQEARISRLATVKRRPHVTIVAHVVAPTGGQDRATAELVKALLRLGIRITVVAGYVDLEDHANLRVIRVPMPARPAALAYVIFYLLAAIALWIRRSDVVHTSGAIIPNHIDVATIHFCHEYYYGKVGLPRRRSDRLAYRLNEWVFSWLSRICEKRLSRKSRTVLCPVSKGVADELRSCYPALTAAVKVVPNGVDSERFSPNVDHRHAVREELLLSESASVAVFLGGDWTRKGLAIAIEAIVMTSDWHLVVVGDGPRTLFEKHVESLNAVGRVHFVGPQARPERFLAAGDAFVLPSAYEAFPLVLLEAAACGLPLIVSPINGASEVVEAGTNGWIVERRPESIADRLVELGSAPQHRAAMGNSARSAALGFGWGEVARQYAALYDAILGNSLCGDIDPAENSPVTGA